MLRNVILLFHVAAAPTKQKKTLSRQKTPHITLVQMLSNWHQACKNKPNNLLSSPPASSSATESSIVHRPSSIIHFVAIAHWDLDHAAVLSTCYHGANHCRSFCHRPRLGLFGSNFFKHLTILSERCQKGMPLPNSTIYSLNWSISTSSASTKSMLLSHDRTRGQSLNCAKVAFGWRDAR